jgi:electron transfer flavoprotein alpha subunit
LNVLPRIESNDQLREYKDIVVFVEIKDHEIPHSGSIELIGKARSLADQIHQKVKVFTYGLNCEQYLPELIKYQPDEIYYYSSNDLLFKHYNEEIIVPLVVKFLTEHKPTFVLFAATEVGQDLSSRIAYRLHTGLTADCTDLSILSDENHLDLLQMVKPAFEGNINANIICPEHRPQMCTVRPGTFKKILPTVERYVKVIQLHELLPFTSKIHLLDAPTRYALPRSNLENAEIIVAGGHGLGSNNNFKRLEKLAFILRGELGATRVPIFNNWAQEDRLIGQTGHIVRPRLYLACGISGQIQHTSGMNQSEIIVAINKDPTAPIHEIADYSIVADLNTFIPTFISELEKIVNLRFRSSVLSDSETQKKI